MSPWRHCFEGSPFVGGGSYLWGRQSLLCGETPLLYFQSLFPALLQRTRRWESSSFAGVCKVNRETVRLGSARSVQSAASTI